MIYDDFLKTKQKSIIHSGFEINESELNPMLFPFQKFTVKRALKAGKYAIFADTGQGKTPMQYKKYCKLLINTIIMFKFVANIFGCTKVAKNTFHISEVSNETHVLEHAKIAIAKPKNKKHEFYKFYVN